MINQNIKKFGMKCKGEVEIFKRNKNTNKIIQSHKQDNLFLLNGRKKILHQLGSSACYARIILSTSITTPNILATTIPSTILWAESTGTPSYLTEINGLSITKRMYVNVPTPSVSTTRSIGTIGVANQITGAGALCYTKLTSVITQHDDEILDVYYSIILSAN